VVPGSRRGGEPRTHFPEACVHRFRAASLPGTTTIRQSHLEGMARGPETVARTRRRSRLDRAAAAPTARRPLIVRRAQPFVQATLRLARLGACQLGTRPVFGTRATILRRVDGIGAKRCSGMPTPARIVEKPARQRNEIRLVTGNDCFRLVRADNHADCLYRNASGLFDRGGERHLVAWCYGGPRLRTDAAGGNADVMETDCAEIRSEGAGLIRRDPTVDQSQPVMRMPSGFRRGQASRVAAATSSG
jgi:hypothetical protein